MPRPYVLSCHCGAFRFEVDAELERVGECNCSTCGRYGMISWKVPASALKLLTWTTSLTSYKWREAVGGHEFCPCCGVMLMSSGYPGDIVAVNARCIEGIDVFTLQPARYDGRHEMPPGPLDRLPA
jgi:hypothetical protein